MPDPGEMFSQLFGGKAFEDWIGEISLGKDVSKAFEMSATEEEKDNIKVRFQHLSSGTKAHAFVLPRPSSTTRKAPLWRLPPSLPKERSTTPPSKSPSTPRPSPLLPPSTSSPTLPKPSQPPRPRPSPPLPPLLPSPVPPPQPSRTKRLRRRPLRRRKLERQS